MDEFFDKVSAINFLLEKIPIEVLQKDGAEVNLMKICTENNAFPLLY